MANTFSTTGGTSHSTDITELTPGATHTYYVKCRDEEGNPSLQDMVIQFEVASSDAASTARSGDWSDPAIWESEQVPEAGQEVQINSGHIVTYDVQSDAMLAGLNINGTLKFSRTTDTRLKTSGNIMVMEGGYLDMGTEDDFIPREVTAEVVFVLPEGYRFTGGPTFKEEDTGLWAMDGSRWEVHGAPLVRAWSKLTQDAPAGSATLVVESDVSDWYVGGYIFLSPTNVPLSYHVRDFDGREMTSARWQGEVRTVVQIEPLSNGTSRITLDAPLAHTHEGTEPIQAAVGLLTRSIVFTTEIPRDNPDNLNPSLILP